MRISDIFPAGILLAAIITGNAEAQYSFNVKRTFHESSHEVLFAAYSSSGRFIVTSGFDSSVIIWDADKGIIYRTLPGISQRVNTAKFVNDDQLLLTAGKDNNITLWDLDRCGRIKTFTGHREGILSLDASKDNRYLASGSKDQTIRIWDLRSQALIYELHGHRGPVNKVKFSNDGSMLVSGGADGKIILWSVADGRMISSSVAHKSWIRDLEFSPDGNTIATCGDDHRIRLWDFPSMQLKTTLKGHHGWVQSIDFSPDGKSLLSGGHDRCIILWDTGTGKLLHRSKKQTDIVLSVDVSPLRPDFITACLHSENLETWALSGIDITQWKGQSTGYLAGKKADESVINDLTQNPGKPEEPIESMIKLYAPLPVNGRVIQESRDLKLVGKVTDKDGIEVLLINGVMVNITEGGIFQHSLELQAGENTIILRAINKNGLIDEVKFTSQVIVAENKGLQGIGESRYFALLIGISNYADEAISDLENPIRDAENLREELLNHYTFDNENIILLKDPTRAEMMMALDKFGKELTEEDNLLIFYAGHGYWDERGNVGYWFPSDASRSNTVDWFWNSTMRDFIGSIQSRHTLLIADACFSGAIFKTRAAFSEAAPKGINKLYELPSRKAMTSGVLQEVPDKSVFIEYLIKRLNENTEQYLPAEVLFSSFKTAVMNNSPNVPQFGTIQNVGDEGGDFIFVKRMP
jgi:WD40 repeat protein